MLLRTFFANSKLDPHFFTTDTAIEGMVATLGFKGDLEATAAEFSKEGVAFLVRNYLANEPYGEGIELKPSPFDNAYVEIVGMDNPHAFYLFVGEGMQALANWVTVDPETDEGQSEAPPEGFEEVLQELQYRIGEIHGTFLIEPVIGTIGLTDGTTTETALAVLFPTLHSTLLGINKAVDDTNVRLGLTPPDQMPLTAMPAVEGVDLSALETGDADDLKDSNDE